MPRPKKGTKGHKEAIASWRATMEEKYGGPEGVRKKMQEMGKKGGKLSRGGGFASMKRGKDGLTGPERAKLVGTIGGFISRRGPAKKKGQDV